MTTTLTKQCTFCEGSGVVPRKDGTTRQCNPCSGSGKLSADKSDVVYTYETHYCTKCFTKLKIYDVLTCSKCTQYEHTHVPSLSDEKDID